MKKFLLALSVCALLSLLLLPPVLAHKPTDTKKPRTRPTALVRRAPATQQTPTQPDVSAEAQTSGPGVTIDPASFPMLPAPQEWRIAEEAGEESAPESDIDPETLRRLKQQPFVPAGMPSTHTVRTDGAAAGATAPAPLAPLAPTLGRNFTGPNSDQQGDHFLRRPPDPDVAVGPAHIVTVVNTIIAVYDKNGTQLQIGNLSIRFSGVNCTGCNTFDPRVIYDPNANRFVVMMVTKNDSTQESKALVAVSQTGDPTGLWWNYAIDTRLDYNNAGTIDPTWADYPDMGFDGIPADNGGAIYLTSNQFTFGTNSFRTSMLVILPKASLYTGAMLNYWRAADRRNADGSQAFTLRAAKTYGNPGVEYLINSRSSSSFASLWRVVPTFPPTPVDWTLQTTYNIGFYTPAPDAPQPGCGNLLDTSDNRMYNAVWRNNRIYAGFTEAHNFGSGTVAALRLLKLNTSTNTVEVSETYGVDGLYYWFPAITADSADNFVVTFARGNINEFAGARYTGRRTTDTQTEDSIVLKAGVQCLPSADPSTSARYGDYQGAAVDPNGTDVWVYGEYTADSSVEALFDWGTWVGQVKFGTTGSSGSDTAGLYNPATSTFFLRNANSAGAADIVFGYGPAGSGWTPLAGDWDGNRTATAGLYNPATSTFFLKNSNAAGAADLVFSYGPAGLGWVPLVGDWDGNGTDTVGLYNPSSSTFFLKNTNTAGAADIVFSYGPAGSGWTPLAGDWNGDGVDTIGLYNPATGAFFLKNSNAAGAADIVFGFGPGGLGWLPLTGDWDGDGVDTVGVYNPSSSTFFLRNSNAAGAADLTFPYGPAGAGWTPLVGNWDGL